MNEIGCAIVDIVIVALVTQALSVTYIVAQIGPVLHGLDMMGLKSFVTTAYLTAVLVTFKHGLTPSQVVGAATTLGIPRIPALGYALARHTAIGVFVQRRIGALELLVANLASTERGIGKSATLARAIDMLAHMRRGAAQLLAAVLTHGCNFLRLSNSRARARAVPLLGVLGPATVGALGYGLATRLTGFQLMFHSPYYSKAVDKCQA